MWSVLRDSGYVDVVGELDYGRILAMTAPREDLRAEVILVAHRLVIEYGLALIPMLRDLFAPTQIMVHSDVDGLEVAAEIYAAGAHGYYTLSSAPGQLPMAVSLVSEGKYWGPREAIVLMAERVIDAHTRDVPEEREEEIDVDDRTLLELLNEGLSNKEIGQRMGLAEPTIKARFNRLYKRFGVATRLQLLSMAISRGFVIPR